MMSKRQWFALFCIYMGYVLFGASIFYTVEHKEEKEKLKEEHNERLLIEDLIKRNYIQNEEHSQKEIFQRISHYCDKPLGGEAPFKTTMTWSFYHSVFFVMTIISTIGYGNLAPTTPFTRTFMILYGVIGIPINGMVIITLGDFFAKTFYKLYKRWKDSRIQKAIATLGLIGETILYLLPGLAFFIIIPSTIIVLYEDWSYDLAVEFAFATLTTVGVGSVVPGTQQKDHSDFLFTLYKIFLLLWIVSGLGYLAMVFSFISRGLRSKQLRRIEHKLAHNIKKTNKKIRQEFRTVLNEYLLMKVKRVYRERRTGMLNSPLRTQSCPNLRLYETFETPKLKRRAHSECIRIPLRSLQRTQSDTDLSCIDKNLTFETESNQFLQKVAKALGDYNNIYYDDCNECNKQDQFDTTNKWEMRPRAATDSHKKHDRPQKLEFRKMQEAFEHKKYGKARSRTLPPIQQPTSFFAKIKNTFKPQRNDNTSDIESQISDDTVSYKRLSSIASEDRDKLLEETSIADFFRILVAFDLPDSTCPRRKFGTTLAPRLRREPIVVSPSLVNRKTSLVPDSVQQQGIKHRSFSLTSTTNVTVPEAFGPLYKPHEIEEKERKRKKSVMKPTVQNSAQRFKRVSWQHSNLNNAEDKNK